MPPPLVPQYGLERDSSPFLAVAGNISVSCGRGVATVGPGRA